MTSTYERVLKVLCGHVSNINAELILARALRDAHLTREALTEAKLPDLLPRLERAGRLFLAASAVQSIQKSLTSGAPLEERDLVPRRITIRYEQDISEARMLARQMCEQLHARDFAVRKVATTVSELARNIFSYTKGGEIELTAIVLPPPSRILVRAHDTGPGIPNLDDILSGRYRSKTGLGLGLLGTKRLVDRFDVQTGAGGTRVEAEIRL